MVRRFFSAAIIVIALGAPIVEMFDRWDQTLTDGNDTEANVVVAALCIGVAFAVGTIVVVNRVRSLAFTIAARLNLSHIAFDHFNIASILLPTPTTSPPTILRV